VIRKNKPRKQETIRSLEKIRSKIQNISKSEIFKMLGEELDNIDDIGGIDDLGDLDVEMSEACGDEEMVDAVYENCETKKSDENENTGVCETKSSDENKNTGVCVDVNKAFENTNSITEGQQYIQKINEVNQVSEWLIILFMMMLINRSC
jgi:hypothetical protein